MNRNFNDKDDNDMILGAVHKFPDICLVAEENPRQHQLGGKLMMAVRPVIASNRVSYLLQLSSVESHSTSGRERKENSDVQ